MSEWAIQLTISIVLLSLFFGALNDWTVLPAIVFSPVLVFPVIAVHELGHVIAAMLTGQQVVLVTVYRAAWHVANRELVYSERVIHADAGGWVATVPRSARTDTPVRHVLTLLGGPAANLAALVLSLVALQAVPSEPRLLTMPVQALLLIFAVLNLWTFGVSITPNGKTNDGQQLLDHIRKPATDPALRRLGYAAHMLHYTVRLRDLPEWMLAPIPEESETDARRYLALTRCARLLDAEHVDHRDARRQLEEYRSRFGADHWNTLCLAFVASVYERDPAATRSMLVQIAPPSDLPQMYHGVLAALAMLENDPNRAQAELYEMDKIIAARSPYTDLTFADIRARIEAIEPLRLAAKAP